jgi:hypothetical protein
MTKQKEVLVLFEDGIIREESVLYSIELARRLELPVSLLMLVSDETQIFRADETLINESIKPIEQAGIEVFKEIRTGDKTAELLKYLAANSSPAAIVWGSDKEMVGKLGAGKSHYWLHRLTGMLPCSIVWPVSKNKGINKK